MVQQIARPRTPLAVGALAAIAVGLAFAPLLYTSTPIQDYPNHLARIFILRHLDDPLIAQHYKAAWGVYPNLGWEALMFALRPWLALADAGHAAVGLASGLIIAGAFVFNRALVGRWTLAPALAAPALFQVGSTRGFFAFNFGIGVALLATAWWVSVPERLWLRRLGVATCFSTALFFIHFATWGVYGLILLGVWIEDEWRGEGRAGRVAARFGRLARDGLQALPAVVLGVIFLLKPKEPEGAMYLVDGVDGPLIRLTRLGLCIDTGSIRTTALLAGLFVLTLGFAIWKARLRFAGRMRAPLLILAAVFFVVPDDILDNHYVVARVAVPLMIWGIASLVVRPDGRPRAFHQALLAALGIAVAAGLCRAPGWQGTQRGAADFSKLSESIPEGARVFVVHVGMKAKDLDARAPGLFHVGSYGVISRKLLVQSTFAYPTQQPLRFTDLAYQVAPSHAATVMNEITQAMCRRGVLLRDHLTRFDYVVAHGPLDGWQRALLPRDRFATVARVGDFQLLKRDAARDRPPLRPGAVGCIRTHVAVSPGPEGGLTLVGARAVEPPGAPR